MKKTIKPYLQSSCLAGMLSLLTINTGSAQEIDYSKTLPQNVFPTPILNPMADKTWGEPAITWHNGEYFMIYDIIQVSGPLCLMTSRDRIYWKEEGPILTPGEGCRNFACCDIRRFSPDGPYIMNYDAYVDTVGNIWETWFAKSHNLRNWKKIEKDS